VLRSWIWVEDRLLADAIVLEEAIGRVSLYFI
jgi:hypothetical protein